MARARCALMIVLAGAAFAPSVAAQPPGSAGERRPKLEVLQALPESQLFPVMNLVAESLGVRCDYCHVQVSPDLSKTPSNVGGWVWDRDDKAPKRTAREMMRMVVELNDKRFHGEARVTCFTCHRGATQPTRLPPQPPRRDQPTTPAAPVLPSADQVWDSYVTAVGPVNTRAGADGIVLSGWDDRPEGRYGKVEISVAGADRYRITLTTADGVINQGMNGDVAWAIAPNGRVPQLGPDGMNQMRRIAMRYQPVKVVRPADLRVVGVERLADRDAYVATARIDAVTSRALYFDVVTGLLRRDVITTETLLLPLVDQVEYDDYRNVNGVQLPFRIRTSDGAPYSTTTKTFNAIRYGVTVEEARFRMPPAQ